MPTRLQSISCNVKNAVVFLTDLIGFLVSNECFNCFENDLNRSRVVRVQVIEVVLESENGFFLVFGRFEDRAVREVEVVREHEGIGSDEIAELRENHMLCFPE